jgi:hypothetical protein
MTLREPKKNSKKSVIPLQSSQRSSKKLKKNQALQKFRKHKNFPGNSTSSERPENCI